MINQYYFSVSVLAKVASNVGLEILGEIHKNIDEKLRIVE